MRVRAVLALCILAALATVALPAAAVGADGLKLRPTAGASFPDRAYVLSLPTGAYLGPDSVSVRENGTLMRGVTVVPAQDAVAGQFAVVLVIDASKSMRGPAIAAALDAARAFADHRQGSQVMGIVVFNSTAKILLPFTSDSKEIEAALEQAPPLAEGTHIYDAVQLGVSMLEEAKITVGSVIVLSDGADTGSRQSLDDAVAAARDSRVRVFSVGLRSKAFNPEALDRLARGAGGEYSEARIASDLKPIFDSLGAKLTSEYLIRYESPAPPHRKVFVAVKVKGFTGVATVGYEAPGADARQKAPFSRSALERFVRSAAGMVATAFFAAGLMAGGLLVLIRPRRRQLKRRLADFVSLPEDEEKRREQVKKDLPFDRAEKSFEGMRWWSRFKEDLDVARITIPPVQILVWTAAATVIAVYVIALLGGTLAGLLGLCVPFVVRGLIRRRLDRQRQLFAEQLPDNLQVLASALRAGHSLVGALSVVVDDSPDPSRREFRRVIADEQLGVPLEDAIELVANRMDSTDLKQVGLVAALQHETGGNTAEVLDRVAETVRERFELRRLVRTLTAQGRLSRWILTGLPVFLLLVITLLNPSYIAPLYDHTGGRILLILATIMVTSGSLVIRRIINIKV
jgi:tight adherence protein B